jgi:hypothetical protein
MLPETEHRWWDNYAAIRDDILSYADFDIKVGEIAAHPSASRVVAKSLLEHYRTNPDKTLEAVMDEFQAERDPRLALILDFLWNDAPDNPMIHDWPSWGRFCDLCSESYVLFEDAGALDEYEEDEEAF